MPRKGWSSMQVPDGWLQVIRGPRPKSVQWPVQSRLPTSAQSPGTPPPQFPRGRWRSGDPQNRREQNSITAIERALTALGPEDVSVKDGLEAVLRRAKDKAKVATPARALVPEVTFEAARVRVVKLEAALVACGFFRTRSRCLFAALAHAKVAASPSLVDVLTVMTNFGQSVFGQSVFDHRVLPANFGQSFFGQHQCLVFWPFLANDIFGLCVLGQSVSGQN